jgi:hypothetical protein
MRLRRRVGLNRPAIRYSPLSLVLSLLAFAISALPASATTNYIQNPNFSSGGSNSWIGATIDGSNDCNSSVETTPDVGNWTSNTLSFSYQSATVTQSITLGNIGTYNFSINANNGWANGGTFSIGLLIGSTTVLSFSNSNIPSGSGTLTGNFITTSANQIVTLDISGNSGVFWSGCYGPQFSSASIINVIPSLATPSAPNVSVQTSTSIGVNDSAVDANAVSVTISIYQSDGVTLVTSSSISKSQITLQNLFTGLSPGNTYEVSVTAVGDGSNYLSSTSTQTSIYLPPIPVPVTLSYTGSNFQFMHTGTLNLVATLGGSDGVVTFYENGKKIFHCVSLLSTSEAVYCGWKPDIHGMVKLTAYAIPNYSGMIPSNASPIYLYIGKRSVARG